MRYRFAAYDDGGSDFDKLVLLFELESEEEDFEPERAMRKAIAAYLKTPEGKETIKSNCDNFNWGDAADLPNEFCRQFGFTIRTCITDHVVDLNESFIN